MKNILRLPTLLLLTACLSLLGLSGCGGDSSVVAGPGGGSSFSGTTITINPTLQFSSGGVVLYTNAEPGSAFPAAPSGVSGTYTYTPSANFSSGTLTLTLPAPVGTVVLTLSNFQVQNGNVTSFNATYNGRGFTSSITTGTLPSNGSSGGGGSLGANEALASAIPGTMQGSYTLSFFKATFGPGMTDTTIAADDTQTFIIGASTLQIGSKTLSNPVFRNSNAAEWIFKDGAIEYEASIAPGGALNEINVGAAGGSPWLGQYNSRK